MWSDTRSITSPHWKRHVSLTTKAYWRAFDQRIIFLQYRHMCGASRFIGLVSFPSGATRMRWIIWGSYWATKQKTVWGKQINVSQCFLHGCPNTNTQVPQTDFFGASPCSAGATALKHAMSLDLWLSQSDSQQTIFGSVPDLLWKCKNVYFHLVGTLARYSIIPDAVQGSEAEQKAGRHPKMQLWQSDARLPNFFYKWRHKVSLCGCMRSLKAAHWATIKATIKVPRPINPDQYSQRFDDTIQIIGKPKPRCTSPLRYAFILKFLSTNKRPKRMVDRMGQQNTLENLISTFCVFDSPSYRLN